MKIKSSLLAVASAILIAASPLAQAFYTQFGDFRMLPSGKARIGDIEFRISPTVKVYREDGQPMTLEEIKNGDQVEASIIKINKRLLVDTIYISNTPVRVPEKGGE
jgi:hypothetical protein